jgi:hypothetical protein
MSKIEMGRVYRTRDGREVRIYAVDGDGECPIHGAVKNPTGWHPMIWYSDGRFTNTKVSEFGPDLIEVRPRIKREVWVNVYRDPRGGYHESKYEADRYGGNRIACVKLVVDCEEGAGLD